MSGEVHALIKVLGSMGPPAVPALLQIAESDVPAVTVDALDEVVRLEPRSNFFGRALSAWEFWRPADNRMSELQRQLTPLLPRVSQVMERGVRQWKPQSSGTQRPAAYLLARWGTGRARARGVQVLDDLARANGPSYYGLDAIRLLRLGDRRGIPARLETLDSVSEDLRKFACLDLRAYSQQPLPCDAGASPPEHSARVAAWRAWWKANERTFRVRSREAALDLEAFPISPVSFGARPVR